MWWLDKEACCAEVLISQDGLDCLSLYQWICWWWLLADPIWSRQHDDPRAIPSVDTVDVCIKSTSLQEVNVMAEKLTLDTLWPLRTPLLALWWESIL